MTAAAIALPPEDETLADLLDRLGDVPAHRIRIRPSPGTATARDVVFELEQNHRLCELVAGVLIEKPMGYYESIVASALIGAIHRYLAEHPLGIVAGEAGAVTLFPGLIRIPDVSFVSWKNRPQRVVPAQAVPSLVPDLAVEVLSESNTKAEMQRKLGEYFESGVRLVWYFEPEIPRFRAFTSPIDFVEMGETGVVEGGNVLPGFALPIRDWLRSSDPRPPLERAD